MPGAELDGIYYLRTLDDCDALRARIEDSGRVAVVGAGWIGSEFAASARQLGLDVTVVEPLAVPKLINVLAFYKLEHDWLKPSCSDI